MGGWTGRHCRIWAKAKEKAFKESEGSGSGKPVKSFIFFLFIVAFVVGGVFSVWKYTAHGRMKETSADGIFSFADTPDQSTNIAPMGNATASSTRDYMAEFNSRSLEGKDDAVVVMGPPEDEDGNPLDNVNII